MKIFKIFILPAISIALIVFYFDAGTVDDLVKKQLSYNAYNSGIWDKYYLDKNQEVRNLLESFEKGIVCSELKNLESSFKQLSSDELVSNLRSSNYKCNSFRMTSSKNHSKYLTKNANETDDENNPDIVYQDVCIKISQKCLVRIKKDGFPGSIRKNPHYTKAVLLNFSEEMTPYELYQNEAFKITDNGKPVPKSPSKKDGMAECRYKDSFCRKWVDKIMDYSHINLGM